MAFVPDFNFEQKLRQFIVADIDNFTKTPNIVNGNPQFRAFLIQYNSYQNYLSNIGTAIESYPFIDLLILYEMLLRQRAIMGQLGDEDSSLPIFIGLFRKFTEKLDKPIGEFIQDQTKEILEKLKKYEIDLKKLYDEELKKSFEDLPDTNKKVREIHKKIIEDPTDIPAIKDLLDKFEARLDKKLDDIQKHFDGALKKAREDAVKYADETKKEVIDTICEEIPNRVVGESYFRYNSTSSFYPTMSLVFLEETQNNNPRRAQMRIKIDKTSEQVDQKFIDHIKSTLQSLHDKGFEYGPVRACYVSTDKRFKNTMFVKTKQDAINTLTALYEMVGLPFDENNLSVTEGRNRKSITRRTTSLDGVPPFVQNYNEHFRVNLYRVVIQVNGLARPILIYKNYDL